MSVSVQCCVSGGRICCRLLQEGGEINVGPVKAVRPMCDGGWEVPLDRCEIEKEDGMGFVRGGFINPRAAGDLRLEAGHIFGGWYL